MSTGKTHHQIYEQIVAQVATKEEWDLWYRLKMEHELTLDPEESSSLRSTRSTQRSLACEATKQALELFEQKLVSRYAAQRAYTGPAGLPPESA